MRPIGTALTALRRAPLMSALSVTTIAFSLFAFGLFSLVAVNIRKTLRDVESRVEIRAFLADGTPVDVVSAANGRDALAAADAHAPDLAVLDVMLPDMDGFTVTRRLRAAGKHFPVLFLTAKDDTEDKVTGLTVGGDDYVTKPFSLDEVVARIRAVLRRTQPMMDDDAVIRVDDLELDDDAHEVRRGGTVIELSPTEFKLLRYLMLNPNRVLSKSQILDHVWEYNFNGDASIVESYISYLRRKVDIDPDAPALIQTKRGVGYVLRTAEKR